MKFAKLESIARGMTAEEVTDSLRSLVNDNRFAAVIRSIQDQKDLVADSACQLRMAGSHGALAHAAGVRYGLMELEGKIRQLTDPPKKTGAQAAPGRVTPH